jgi:hypothetical protein
VGETIEAVGSTVQRDNVTDFDNAGRGTATRDGVGNWTDTGYDPVSRPQACNPRRNDGVIQARR